MVINIYINDHCIQGQEMGPKLFTSNSGPKEWTLVKNDYYERPINSLPILYEL